MRIQSSIKKKTIICADSAYSNLGFSKRVKNILEFRKLLKSNNLRSLKLNKKQVSLAKKYLFFCDTFDMRRKFHLSYSHKLKKNYSSRYLPNDRSLTNKSYVPNLKSVEEYEIKSPISFSKAEKSKKTHEEGNIDKKDPPPAQFFCKYATNHRANGHANGANSGQD